MSQTNVQTFSGDVEITGGLSVTGTVISTVGTDKVQLTTTSASETDYIPVSKGATGAQALYTDSNLTYNPSTNQIAANLSGNVTGNVSGNLTGNVSGNIAGSADTVAFTARNATANTDYIAFVDTATAGDKALFTDSNLTYNSSTNTIGANITGNAAFATNATFAASATNAGYATSAGSASTATFATTATSATNANAANAVAFTARNATDNTDYIAFVNDAAAGDKALFTDTNLTYNSSTNTIGANITGNAAYAANAGYANSAGSASTATFATNATNANAANAVAFTDRDTNDETDYIAFVSSHTAGDKALYTDSNLTYNPSTNTIGANITGNAAFATDATYATSAGSAGSATNAGYANSAGSATNATFATNATNANAANAVAFTARNATDDTDYIAFVNNATAGDKALYTDSNLTYNSSTNQIAANLSGNVSGTNVSATTLHYPTQTIQPVLNGGGTVTYNASSYIKWSERVIAIPIESNEMGASGYIDIETPVSGTITYFSGSSGSTTATCTAAGVPMGAWQALYYVVTPGQSSGTDQTRFRLVNYQNSTWNPDSNWILICVRNSDGDQLKWLPGQTILAPGQSYDSTTRGAYGAVFADSATSATRLTTARTIGGVSFNGTANINLPGVNAAGTQNTTGSAAKLTTARTIGGVSFDGSANINLPGVNAAGTQNTTGSAAKLTTARTIGGVSFDGSANIDLPGVNTDGTQNTTGSAATLTTARTINGVDFNGSGDIIVEPYISNDDTGDTNCPIVFTPNTTAGYKRLYEDSALYFDNTNNRLYSTQMSLGDYFYHTNDTNTFFGFPANDTYTIGTAGVERFRVDSGGNVGIGTNGPIRKLDVRSGVGNATTDWISGLFGGTGAYPRVVMGALSSVACVGAHNSALSAWDTLYLNDMTKPVVVDTYGNVGIGTNNPVYKLEVNGTVNTGALTATSATVPNDGDFVMGGKPLTSASGLHWDRVNSRLGVGTNAPAYTLDVNGTARVSDDLTAESTSDNITILAKAPDTKVATLAAHGTAQGTGRLFVGQDSFLHGGGLEYNGDNSPASTGAGQDYLALYRVETGAYNWTARNSYNSNNWEFRGTVTAPTFSGNLSGNITGSAANISSSNATMPQYITHESDTNTYFGFLANDTYVIGTSGLERLRIGSAGNVGIGTDAPAYKLDVNGTVNATALYVGGAPFSGGFDPNVNEIAIGTDAGQTAQGTNTVAVGRLAGTTNQGNSATAVGYQAGETAQSGSATAVGYQAGETSQGSYSAAVGHQAGRTSQSGYTVAVGYQAGASYQGSYATAVGVYAGVYNQTSYGTAVGYFAGYTSQAQRATAVGYEAGAYNQASHAVGVGYRAGRSNQGAGATAVGTQAGYEGQGSNAVAVGKNAGCNNQEAHAIAVGYAAGQGAQRSYAIAVGYNAGYYNQGSDAIAVGYLAGRYNQPAGSFYTNYGSFRGNSGSIYGLVVNTAGEICRNTSDDRLKHDEKFITGAVKSLSKLRPQEYLKRQKLDATDPEQGWTYEAGLMAQEVYYSAPELRHIVQIPPEAGDIDNYTPPPSDDPTQDPDYSVWGNDASTVDYNQLTPYLVKAVQEIVTELPRSKTTVSNAWGQNITGLIVSANANAHKTNTTPIVALSNVYMDKKWYGVVSEKTTDTNDYDTLVDTKGDTQIWVTDVGGPLESGDLVTTSNIAPGYAQKQADDLLRSSTVAKVTQDCDFTEPAQRPVRVPKQELSNVTYYTHDASYEISLEKYENVPTFKTRVDETTIYFKEGDSETRYYQGDTEVCEKKYNTLPEDERSIKHLDEISVDEYESLDDEAKALYSVGIKKRYFLLNYSKSKTQIPQHDEEIVVEELTDVLDENGQIVWEETGETEPVYTLVDHGNYKAALVSAKLV